MGNAPRRSNEGGADRSRLLPLRHRRANDILSGWPLWAGPFDDVVEPPFSSTSLAICRLEPGLGAVPLSEVVLVTQDLEVGSFRPTALRVGLDVIDMQLDAVLRCSAAGGTASAPVFDHLVPQPQGNEPSCRGPVPEHVRRRWLDSSQPRELVTFVAHEMALYQRRQREIPDKGARSRIDEAACISVECSQHQSPSIHLEAKAAQRGRELVGSLTPGRPTCCGGR